MAANQRRAVPASRYQPWVGHRVVIGLESFHYLCGRWHSIDGENGVFWVGDREVRMPIAAIRTVQFADSVVPDYFK